MSTWFLFLSQISIVAFALVGGVFLAFSDFIMRALDTSNSPSGIEVMQVVNREVFKWVFMILLLGMSALSPLIIGYVYFNIDGTASTLIIAGSAIYLIGVFAVTMLFNVPMNNHLDKLDHTSTEAATYWTNVYFPNWTFWNHVRTIASAASAACYLIAVTWLVQAA